ncbi:sensor histidine kinase [Haliovirga abyssi]|uniref:histidine kinase n=1 Tax=Haliovirga abyssi TaxID=2996794 RepID=A0AAU9DRZ6_9FUSO|nr:HAMP domain-containing sensor histidine kinase [Haliovirga abyssi]BDU49749.1 hypothetical protein HLVA_03180 [Haliovirga abyssi]
MNKKLEITLLSISFVVLFLFSIIFSTKTLIYSSFIYFNLFSLVVISAIMILSLRSYLILKNFMHLFFSISYGILMFIYILIMKEYYFNNMYIDYMIPIIKYTEVLIFMFGIFVLREKVDKRKILKSFIILIIVNLFYFFITIFFIESNVSIVIFYIELLLVYSYLSDESIKDYFTKILWYKIFSWLFGVIYTVTSFNYFNLISFFMYFYSLYKFLEYLNYVLNRGFFKEIYNREQKIRKLIKYHNSGIIIIDDYYINYINDSALKILGKDSKRELKNKSIYLALEGISSELLEDTLKKFPEENVVEIVNFNKKNKKIKIKAYKTGDEFSEEIIIILDELLTQKEVFEKANNLLSNNVVYLYNEDEREYVYMNNGVKNILNKSPEDFYNNSTMMFDMIPEGNSKWYMEFMANKKDGLEEFSYVKENGELVWLLGERRKFEFYGNEYYYGVGADISRYKIRENELLLKNEKLEKENKIKDMSVSVISHEIRTPITSIIGFLENIIMNKKFIYPKVLTMVYKVYNNSMRLKELINNLLDINKLNAGKMEISKEILVLKDMVTEIMLNNEILMEIRDIEYSVNIDEELEAYADYNLIYQSINNIVSNAIKYNKDNGKIIVSGIDNEKSVTLSFKDTGIGIKLENINSVFEEYERIEGSHIQGTGIGMPLTKKMVELNGGKIWIESVYGEGSTIFIELLK